MPVPIRVLWISPARLSALEIETLACLPEFSFEMIDDPGEALTRLPAGDWEAAVADLPLPGWTAEELLESAQRLAPDLPLLVRDPAARLADAVRLSRLGAAGLLEAALDAADCGAQLRAAVEQRRLRRLPEPAAGEEPWRRLLVGESEPMRSVAQVIRLVNPRRCTVLITGETGTGKEMAARALHQAGARARFPFVAVNCGALPENLLETELFGHVRGAFTGAVQNRVGRFEQANGGTIFLDEIGEMPLELQAKLLRVLQERELQRLGSSETLRLDVRVVAASNVNLAERVEEGRFREDLYYRLNVVPVEMPPLRRRSGDIPLLVNHFLAKICRAEGIAVKQIGREALERLRSAPWPGNVRQLENAIERAVALSGDRAVLYPGDFALPARPKPLAAAARTAEPVVAVPDGGLDFEQTVSFIERSILEQALRKTNGNKKMAADMLHLKRTTLSAKLRSLEPAVCN